MSPWDDARLALCLLAIDPKGLGGLWLRARSGPVRDRFLGAMTPALAPLPLRRIHPGSTDDALFGGLDLSATLDTGHAVMSRGVLSSGPSALLLTMAERCGGGLVARLSTHLDRSTGGTLIALDEGLEDERLSSSLSDRLGFHLDLEGLSHHDCPDIAMDHDRVEAAGRRVHLVACDSDLITQITHVAAQFGVDGVRAPLFVLRAARAHAAMRGASRVEEVDMVTAARLVLAPRATQVPEAVEAEDSPPPPLPPDAQDTDSPAPESNSQEIPTDMLLQAIAANLPPNILDRLAAQKAKGANTGSDGSGAAHRGNRRGRPKPAQRGRLGGAARMDLVATLRAAAPWQTIRRQAPYAPERAIHIRASDIRLKRFEEKSDRLLIFVVDASGSAALARLAEAKGAVELLLAEAYSRRDHVALIAFRGVGADLLLPPTRSLVQTKRRLSALPGGGGTPLAKGMEAALELALSTRHKGLTPTIALLTDGRANIALDGSADRVAAGADARTMARLIRQQQTPALVIDTGTRPQKALRELALDLAAPYLPLPRADAHRVSQAIDAVLE